MRTIFLADSHLKNRTDKNYRLLLDFLFSLRGETETLFILGDLFDFWLGFPSLPFRQYDEILEALRLLKLSGCRIVYFEGNHDFHLGSFFEKDLDAEIHKEPSIITLQDKRLFICHGDQINSADYAYRMLRALLHNKPVSAIVKHFPPYLALKLKERLQRISQSSYQSKTERWDYLKIIRDFATSEKLKKCDALITGHFHLAFYEKSENSGFTTLSLGDWIWQFTYGEMLGGELMLKHYKP